MTKHELIINYIKALEVGSRISVRQIAEVLEVSEGTAYRAIKEAENLGLVNTIPRVGTIRVEKLDKKEIHNLTFAEVVNIVDGGILGGKSGLHKTLNKFVIGAMEIDAMVKYIEPGSLLIIGNRLKAHEAALKCGAAVLISGGFGTSDEVIKIADEQGLPIITSSYDTFSIAALINKAIFNRLAKKEIILAEDVMVTEPLCINVNQKVSDWKYLLKTTGHSRFPVVDDADKVVGILTSKDTAGFDDDVPVFRVMTKNPLTVTEKASVAYAAHIMVWEDIELLPVVKNMKLVGLITRKDVIKALRYMQNQPHVGETIDDIALNHFVEETIPNGIRFRGVAAADMLNPLGIASCGAIVTLMATAGFAAVRKHRKMDTVTDSFVVYFTRPLQLDDSLEVRAEVLDVGRRTGKIDIEVLSSGRIAAKGMMSVKVLENKEF